CAICADFLASKPRAATTQC
ncbi:transketolase, partial [Vibrio cholerae HC-02C1]